MKAKIIVLDTAPLLHRTPLNGLSDRFLTIPSVLSEVRDQSSREALDSLPVQIQLKQPTEEAIKAVIDFSKLTGDYPVLSKTDLHLLALCWMMEKEANGGKYLRSRPIPPKTISKDTRPVLEPILEEKKENSLTLSMSDLTLEDDGEGEWITPSNVQKVKSNQSFTKSERVWDVACMTSDFAMQNVLMQMGMKVLGEDGRLMKKLRLSVLRCHACYK
jgi:RNA-binding protein NOB1